MPPLPPNITKAGILRTQRGWATSRQSLINNNIRGIGRARMPHGIGSVTGGMLNPPLPPSATRLAMPKGAMSGWAPVSLAGTASQIPLINFANKPWTDALGAAPNDLESQATLNSPVLPQNQKPTGYTGDYLAFTSAGTPDASFFIGYDQSGNFIAWQSGTFPGQNPNALSTVVAASANSFTMTTYGTQIPLFELSSP